MTKLLYPPAGELYGAVFTSVLLTVGAAQADAPPQRPFRPVSPAKAESLRPISERLLPAPKNGGFRMKDFHVWCGSLIQAEGKYQLFASRWPKATRFPGGYRTHSEIVRAVADRPEGPFTFVERVIGPRKGGFWDSRMAHNPKILRLRDQYVLVYIGSNGEGRLGQRASGYAVADRIAGPWRRSDRPFENLVQSKGCPQCDATNPSLCPRPDGSLLLVYRLSPEMVIRVAIASTLAGPWETKNGDVWRSLRGKAAWQRFEDPDVVRLDDHYEMILEDNDAKQPFAGYDYGIHLKSHDGIRWELCDPSVAYTTTIAWDDGTQTTVYRRERPQMFVQDGRLTHIVTAVKDDPSPDESRIVIQPVAPK